MTCKPGSRFTILASNAGAKVWQRQEEEAAALNAMCRRFQIMASSSKPPSLRWMPCPQVSGISRCPLCACSQRRHSHVVSAPLLPYVTVLSFCVTALTLAPRLLPAGGAPVAPAPAASPNEALPPEDSGAGPG